jgi:exosortase
MATTVERAPTRAEPALQSPPQSWRGWLVLAALAVAYAPLLWQHAVQLWLRPHYQFFPLVVLGAGWLAYIGTRGLGTLTPGRAGPTAASVGLCLLALAGAVLLNSSWLAAASLPPLLGSLAYAAGGWPLLRAVLPALVLLSVAVPPPLELDRNLVLALQRRTTVWSSAFLDMAGVFHAMAGNVVEVNGQPLLVDEACSGINSLFVVVACTLFVIFHERRPPVWAVLLLLSAVGWVLLANVARVFLITLLKARHGIDLTVGWKHDALGFALFGAALLLIWSTDRLLRFLLTTSSPEGEAAPAPAAREAAPRGRVGGAASPYPLLPPAVGAWALLGPAVALAALQIESLSAPEAAGAAPAPTAGVERLTADTLPREWGRWRRGEFSTKTRNPGSYFGEVSKMWTYELGKNGAIFSLDYPFPSWHDLTRCYTSQGWVLSGQAVHPAEGDRDGFVEVALSRPGHREGYLLFSQYDGLGQAMRPRPGGPGLSLFRHGAALARWQRRLVGQAPEPAERPPVYQAQLFVETFTPLTPAEQEAARAFFHEALPRVTRVLKAAD